MELKLSKNQRTKNNIRFGGNMLLVYARDKYRCVDCGMTYEQHKQKYRRGLTINHIDGTGRYKTHAPGAPETYPIMNNSMDNLETLCLPCHGRKDGARTHSNQHGSFE